MVSIIFSQIFIIEVTNLYLYTSKIKKVNGDINTFKNITLSLNQVLDYIKNIGIILHD